MNHEALYRKKNELLQSFYGNPVNIQDFYTSIFNQRAERRGHAEDNIANPIIALTSNRNGKRFLRNYIVFDDKKEFSNAYQNEFALCGLCTYRGKNRTSKNANSLYGFCVDIDKVGLDELQVFHWAWDNDRLPRPTYVANSGHGIHLYYVFFNPIPLYKEMIAPLNRLKHGLTVISWTPRTSKDKLLQFQPIWQNFRMVGSCTKLGTKNTCKNYLVTAYKVGDRTDLYTINKYVKNNDEFPKDMDYWASSIQDEEHLTLEKAKQLYPEWYQKRIVEKIPAHQYRCPKGLYDWWYKIIQRTGAEQPAGTLLGARQGTRYYCIGILFAFAFKCGVPKEETYKDAVKLIPLFNEDERLNNPEEPDYFTEEDIKNAMKFYSPAYSRFGKKGIWGRTHIVVDKQRRNGRPQALHLKLARSNQQVINSEKGTDWRYHGGAPTQQQTVADWRAKHPNGSKVQCKADTGLTYPTIRKWW